jgi:pumilio homology domain family member 6
MRTAVAAKNPMNGTKRKGAPYKDAGAKDSKKPKIDYSIKSTMKRKAEPVRKVEEQSDSEDFDSDGGTLLHSTVSVDLEDLEESDATGEDSDGEASPAVKDGLHPERAKAAVVNSKNI